MSLPRKIVYEAIDGERKHQDLLWENTLYADGISKGIGDYLAFMESCLRKAIDDHRRNHGGRQALHGVREVAALAVACLEMFGAPERQSIRLAHKHVRVVEDGIKKVTIRKGHRPYYIGPATFMVDELLPLKIIHVRITEVLRTTLAGLGEESLYRDGFISRGHVLRELQGYYPDLTLDDPITAVRFELEGPRT